MVHNVPETTLFFPIVKGEIASYNWFTINELPGGPDYTPARGRKEQFFMVNPFVRSVKALVNYIL